MSDYEHYRGKLIEIKKLENENNQDVAKRILEERNIKIDNYYENDYLLYIRENLYKVIEIINNKFYSVIKEELDPYEDVYEAKENPDGSIDFIVKYYNGGVCFSDAIEKAIKRIKK